MNSSYISWLVVMVTKYNYLCILLAIDKMYRKFRISHNNDEQYQLHKKGLLRNPKTLTTITITIIRNFSYFVHKYL